MAYLIFQSFEVKSTAFLAMLDTIQEMKFFPKTAYRDLTTFAGLTIEIKPQDLGQGNGASPAGWCVITIAILWAHGAKEHRAHFLAPLSQIQQSLLAIFLY
jgi:hypothetical protein